MAIGRSNWLLVVTLLVGGLTGCSLKSSPNPGPGPSPGPTDGAHTVSLAWKASTSSNVVGYNVYRGTTSGSYGLLDSMNASTSFTDSTVQNGQTYFYVVTAVDSSGMESPHSNVAQAIIP